MEDDTDHAKHISDVIRFRNPDSLSAIITQMFLVVAACLVILGLVYVVIVVILITIHYFCFDRNPNVIPEFVKRSVQFSSDEEDPDFEHDMNAVDLFQRRRMSNKSSEWTRGQPSNAKKTQLLEQFLTDFKDQQRGMFGTSRND